VLLEGFVCSRENVVRNLATGWSAAAEFGPPMVWDTLRTCSARARTRSAGPAGLNPIDEATLKPAW